MLPGTPVVCAANELHCTPYKHVISQALPIKTSLQIKYMEMMVLLNIEMKNNKTKKRNKRIVR